MLTSYKVDMDKDYWPLFVKIIANSLDLGDFKHIDKSLKTRRKTKVPRVAALVMFSVQQKRII